MILAFSTDASFLSIYILEICLMVWNLPANNRYYGLNSMEIITLQPSTIERER